jgi:hypothetical protein
MSKSYTPLPVGACMALRDSFTFVSTARDSGLFVSNTEGRVLKGASSCNGVSKMLL